MKPRFLKKVLLATFIITSMLLAFEIFVSLYFPTVREYPNGLVGYHNYPAAESDYLPFTLPPNMFFEHHETEFNVSYCTNGFAYLVECRNSSFTSRTENARERILFLGDSFTFGWGNNYEDSFVGLLSEDLKYEKIDVINAAYHAGYSPDSYYTYLINEGVDLDSDKIFVVIYTGNDVEDMQTTIWEKLDVDGAPVSISTTRDYTDYEGKLIKPEKFWYYNVPVFRYSKFFIAFGKVINKQILKSRELSYKEAYERFKISINGIITFTENEDTDLTFVLIPMKPSKCSYGCIINHEEIFSFLSSLNISVVDLRNDLTDEYYYGLDGHLNKKGNKFIFNVLRDELG